MKISRVLLDDSSYTAGHHFLHFLMQPTGAKERANKGVEYLLRTVTNALHNTRGTTNDKAMNRITGFISGFV